MAYAGKRQQFKRAKQEAHTGDGNTAVFRALPFAKYAVKRKGKDGQQSKYDSRNADLYMEWIDNDDNAYDLEDNRGHIAAANRFVQEQSGKHHDKCWITGKENRNYRCIGICDGKLVERHTDRDAKKSEQCKKRRSFTSMRTPLFFIVLTAKGMRNIPPARKRVMVSCIGLKSPAISLRAISIVLKRMVEITIYIQPFFTKTTSFRHKLHDL